MARSLSPRIDQDIREVIDNLAKPDGTINDTAEQLIRIGIAVRSADCEPVIKGPLGFPRPFAEISLSKRTSEIRTAVDDAVSEELTTRFDNKPNTAAREALRLGVLTVAGDQFTIEGPAGGPRPFAEIDVESINNQDIRELITELQNQMDNGA